MDGGLKVVNLVNLFDPRAIRLKNCMTLNPMSHINREANQANQVNQYIHVNQDNRIQTPLYISNKNKLTTKLTTFY